MNAKQFKESVEKKAKALQASLLEARRELLFEFFYVLVEFTPLDTGRLRSGWTVGLERGTTGEPNTLDKTGQSAITNASQTLERMKTENTRVFIVNNVPYAFFVNNGTVNMPPAGMVEAAKQRFPEIGKRVFTKVNANGKSVRV